MPPAQIREDNDSQPPVAVSDDAIADEGEALLLPGDDDDEAALPTGGRRDGASVSGPTGEGDDDNEDDDEDGGAEIQDYRGFAAFVGAAGGAITASLSSTSSASPSSTSGPLPNRKPQISSQTIRKGEKDFEEHGTRAQRDALEQSRAVMESVLAHTRVHFGGTPSSGSSSGSKNAKSSSHNTGSGNDIVRGWYFPEVWQDEEEEEEEIETAGASENAPSTANSRRFAHTRHRVVMVEAQRGPMFSSVGAVPGKPKWIPTLPKDQQPMPRPGFDHLWLLPEEALFLVERGSMELWWPLKEVDTILRRRGSDDARDEEEDGVPLSLQAAYALLIGPDDNTQHGRIALPSYQVYTHLRRAGYQVLRAVKTDPQTPLDGPLEPPPPPAPTSLWQWLFSLLSPGATSSSSSSPASSSQRAHAPCGPLVQPGLYRSYGPVYSQLRLIPSHRYDGPPSQVAASSSSDEPQPPTNPFRVVFHVWKAGVSPTATSAAGGAPPKPFSKIRPPPPDFYMAVADAHTTGVPTLEQVSELLASVPPLPASAHLSKKSRLAAQSAAQSAAASKQTSTSTTTSTSTSTFPPLPVIYRRLKLGRRCVLVAVVDHGIVNYMRFSDGTFGTDPLWPRFDAVASGRFSTGGAGGGGARKNGAGGKGKSGGGRNQKKNKGGAKNGTGKGAGEGAGGGDAKSKKDTPSSTTATTASNTVSDTTSSTVS